MRAIFILILVALAISCCADATQYNGGINSSTSVMIHPSPDLTNDTIDSSYYANPITWGSAAEKVNTSSYYSYYYGGTKYNGTSLKFIGNANSYVSVPASDGLNFSSGDFTIDFETYPTLLGGYVISQVSATDAIRMRVYSTGNIGIVFISDSATIGNYVVVSGISNNTWNHIAVQRRGTSLEYYLNGVQLPVTTVTSFGSTPLANISAPLRIGGHTSTYFYNGYVQEVRINKGYAAYPSRSSPIIRTAPYTNWQDTSSSAVLVPIIQNISHSNATVKLKDVTNVSYVFSNITYDSTKVIVENVYQKDTQFETLVATINNSTSTGWVSVNVSNASGLALATTTGIDLFDLHVYNIDTGTTQTITISNSSIWNGNYSAINAGNYYFRSSGTYSALLSTFTPSGPISVIYPNATVFTDTSTGSPTAWNWTYRYNNTGTYYPFNTTQNSIFIPPSSGNFTIHLNASTATAYSNSAQTTWVNVSPNTTLPFQYPISEWCGIQNLFFSDVDSDVDGYGSLLNYATGGNDQDENITLTAADGLKYVDGYISPLGLPNRSTLYAGVRTYGMYGYVSSLSNPSYFTMNVSILNANGTYSTLYNITSNPISSLTSHLDTTTYVGTRNVTLNQTDRILIQIYAYTTRVASTSIHFTSGGTVAASYVTSGYFACPAPIFTLPTPTPTPTPMPTIPNLPAEKKKPWKLSDIPWWGWGVIAFLLLLFIGMRRRR